MSDAPDDEAGSLPLRELHRLAGGVCRDCREGYSARDAVFSIALGFKDAPRCLSCVSRRLGRIEAELRDQLLEYVHRQECYLKAWRAAERMDGVIGLDLLPPAPPPWKGGPRGVGLVADTWHAGDMGCGELVMALRLRMKNLPAGGVMKVTATDPAAPEDLPAWCRLCGHTLVGMTHPDYWIRRKED